MAMADGRPTTFLDYLAGLASGPRLMLIWTGVVLVWLAASLFWLPAALVVPLVLFALYLIDATAFHYGMLPERAEWKIARTTRDMRTHTAVALAVTVCALLFAVMVTGVWR